MTILTFNLIFYTLFHTYETTYIYSNIDTFITSRYYSGDS